MPRKRKRHCECLHCEHLRIDPFDNGADGEVTVYYNINCPYRGGDERAHCFRDGFSKDERAQCVACKMEWLGMEVDT